MLEITQKSHFRLNHWSDRAVVWLIRFRMVENG